jgi:major membrane immunogen (membrane-anchored lipoprotein)
MKRSLMVLFALLAGLGLLSCEAAPSFKDGTYTAQDAEYHNGWKYFVEITVADGKIAAVNYDATSEEGNPNKDAMSRAGNYPMVENGGAQWDWHEQAEKLEAYLINAQSTDTPDAVTGATIGIGGFFALAEEALADAKM